MREYCGINPVLKITADGISCGVDPVWEEYHGRFLCGMNTAGGIPYGGNIKGGIHAKNFSESLWSDLNSSTLGT